MKKFKVLHIFSSVSMGGAEKMTVSIAKNLNNISEEFESVVAAPKDSYIYQQSLKEIRCFRPEDPEARAGAGSVSAEDAPELWQRRFHLFSSRT